MNSIKEILYRCPLFMEHTGIFDFIKLDVLNKIQSVPKGCLIQAKLSTRNIGLSISDLQVLLFVQPCSPRAATCSLSHSRNRHGRRLSGFLLQWPYHFKPPLARSRCRHGSENTLHYRTVTTEWYILLTFFFSLCAAPPWLRL